MYLIFRATFGIWPEVGVQNRLPKHHFLACAKCSRAAAGTQPLWGHVESWFLWQGKRIHFRFRNRFL